MRGGVALVILAGVLFAQVPQPKPKGAIKVTVKDTTGAPVAEISVGIRLDAASHNMIMAGVTGVAFTQTTDFTDETGSFARAGLPGGPYSVWIARDRVTVASREIKVDADQEIAVDFVIPANPAISGRVVNQEKEPEVDAFVWLLKPEYQNGVLKQTVIGPKVTGEDGTYQFDTGLETNRRYYVMVDRTPPEEIVSVKAPDPKDRGPIEAPTYFPSATRLDSGTPVILQPGEHREQVDIKVAREAFYCVDGKIEVSGKPESSSFAIQESALAAQGEEQRSTKLARVRSSAAEDGAFHVCGLSPGAYRLSTEEGFTDFSVSNSDVDGVKLSTERAHLSLQVDWDGDPPPPPAAPKLDDAAKATVRKIVANMGLGDALSDEDQEKLAARLSSPEGPDVAVVGNAVMQMGKDEATRGEISYLMRFLHPRDGVVGSLISIGNGGGPGFGARIPYSGPLKFMRSPPEGGTDPSATGLPAGNYVVDVEAGGPSNPYVKRVEYNQIPLAGGQIQLSPGASGTLHVVVATGIATLGVSVADGDGKPVGNANIVLLPDGVTSIAALSRLAVRGQTDQNGSYTSRPLPPGKYRVLATTQSIRWGVPEDLEKMLLVLFQAKEVELAASNGWCNRPLPKTVRRRRH